MKQSKQNEIFQKEFELLEAAAQLAAEPGLDNNPLHPQFDQLLQGYQKLLQQSVRLVSIGDKQQEHLYKLQSDLKNLLDNTGQGIFSVNPDLLINKGCSSECLGIFGRKIEGEKLPALLSPYNDVEKINLIESVLNGEFFNADPFQQQVMMLLLPDELDVKEKVYAVKYKPIKLELKEKTDNAFLIIFTDITEKKLLQKTLDDEKRVFKTVTKIIADPKTFSGCIKEYRLFYQKNLPKWLNDNQTEVGGLINEIFRAVHTLKGNFAVFEFPWLVDFLEEVEQALSVIRENASRFTFAEAARLINGYDFRRALDQSLQQVYNIIGSQWVLEDDFVIVKQADLKTLELNLQKTDPVSAAELRKICSASIQELLQSYPEYTLQLAGRLEKNIAPFRIECPDEIKVDPEQYAEFFRSLVHVFRNMVDHGIESPDQRIAAGKDVTGKIQCTAAKEKDGFQIRIADDGQGIDVESLKRKAVRLGITAAENVAQMTFDQALHLVFVDGLSLSETQNGISGRGVGLAALNREVERLHGKIEIETAPGQGTAFIFHLPF